MPQLIEVLQFAVPCWLINMALNLIYVAKLYFPRIASLDKPIDYKKVSLDGERVLGESTTWLGLIVAIVFGCIVQRIFDHSENTILLGLILGLAVYLGHALGSYIKRRFGYKDGQYMPFVDHGDYIITAGIILGLMYQFPWVVISLGILVTYIAHPIVTYLAYLVKWHKHPL